MLLKLPIILPMITRKLNNPLSPQNLIQEEGLPCLKLSPLCGLRLTRGLAANNNSKVSWWQRMLSLKREGDPNLNMSRAIKKKHQSRLKVGQSRIKSHLRGNHKGNLLRRKLRARLFQLFRCLSSQTRKLMLNLPPLNYL